MKSSKNILIAFILNLSFSIFELIGGIFTNSVAIMSDAIHDFGDAISIGISFILEKISKKKPNHKYTYGYLRYSIIGAIITNTVLIMGGIFIIIHASKRIINPIEVNYNGMLIFAIFGFTINLIAMFLTKDGHSLNEKAINLHMLEDVLTWLVVLIGSLVIKITEFYLIDSILSILVSLFILWNAIKSYKMILDIFLEKTPKNINIEKIKEHLLKIENVINVHHIHVWSIDGINTLCTMHIVTDLKNTFALKKLIKEELKEHDINHTTIEFEEENDACIELSCVMNTNNKHKHQH